MRAPPSRYILDIDLDFFALTTDLHEEKKYLAAIYVLLQGAEACTIATSPYFMEQARAVRLLSQIIKEAL